MSFDNKKLEFAKEKFELIEFDLDYCTLDYGVGVCTASGSDECYNTLTTCQDTVNFDKGIKTYRVCTNRSPLPIGLPADLSPIPSIKSVSTSPAIIDIKGGLGVRSSLNVALRDLPHNDDGVDKYERAFNPVDVGSWGTKLRARNPEYQNRPIRYYSGYLDNGVFNYSNFQQRSYVIDSLNARNGDVAITAKDILKLVSSKKAQAPAVNTGLTTAELTAVATTIDVDDGTDYTTGYVLIGAEVIEVTNISTNTLTLVRAQFNTTAAVHSLGVTVQQCLYYDGETVDYIVNDLLTNYSSIDSSFIPLSEWTSNMSAFGLLSGIIVKPMDVNKILIELTEAIPHYLWWDERGANPYIRMTPLEAPPENAPTLDMESSLIKNTVSLNDDTKSRVSTVFINFGQYDPTKKLDEPANYQQSWVRVDTDSIAKYGSGEIKVINSRWLSNLNLAGAQKAATLIGRRFADIQRKITFQLDPKDSDGATGLWTGQTRNINYRDICDFNGYPVDTMFQIISASQSRNYKFSGIEFKYGQELTDDITVTDKIVYYSAGSQNPYLNINLMTDWESLYGAHEADSEAIFIIRSNSIIGSSSVSTYSIETDSWPTLTTGFVKIIIQSGCYVAGKGGDGANGDNTPAAENGGGAINLGVDVILEGGGVLGGGGGGGGGNDGFAAEAAGGGGAGSLIGVAGEGTQNTGGDYIISLIPNEDGTISTGGDGAYIKVWSDNEPVFYRAGNGGDLGEAGTLSGGTAGKACNLNGYTLEQSGSGVTIIGTVS